MTAPAIFYRSIDELSTGLRRGEFTPIELVESFLSRIDTLDEELGAFRLLCGDRALEEAEAAGAAIRAGRDIGPLHGIPFAVKDLYDVKGLPTSAGCPLLEDNIAARDATAVRKLLAAGMVLLGKTNTVQFAYGGAGINHHHGTPKNPWHAEPHLPGGSSSGSGVAVAAGLAPLALGSDTGGSVRIPAALCGITGLKTTVGQVSRAGVYPLSSSLDSVGPLGRSVKDTALVYAAMAGRDSEDESTASATPVNVMTDIDRGVEGLRIAFAESVFFEDADEEVKRACRACGEVFESLGARVFSIPFEAAESARRLNPSGLIIAEEAYAVNRRFLDEHFDALDPVVAYRMIKGKDIPAHEYLQTTLDWKRLRTEALDAMRDVDALLCPATMVPALPIAEVDEGVEAYAEANMKCLRNTAIGNILNLCGLSVPCGFTKKGLPVGLMIYGKPFDEATVLRIGNAFQQATDWHRRTPDLAWAHRTTP